MSDNSRTRFYLDPQNGKIKGVCAGIADYTGIEVLWVRLATVMLVLTGVGIPWIPVAYLIVAGMAPNRPAGLYGNDDDRRFWQGVRTNPKRTTAEVRSKFRELDRRLADIETHYTSRNSALADEIERLR